MASEYSVHVDFIKSEGVLIPWHVVFTSALHPYYTHSIGQDPNVLIFTYEDVLYNMNVNNFPRRAPVTSIVADVNREVEALNRTLVLDNDLVVLLAMDQATLRYLQTVLSLGVIRLVEPRNFLLGEAVTMGYVYDRLESQPSSDYTTTDEEAPVELIR